jgi:hypothetical protein
MLLTGDKINGIEAEKLGLVLKSVPKEQLDKEVETLARRMATVPINQLIMHKLMINQTLENMGLRTTQMFATLFDGIARHSPEGMAFKRQAETAGWKTAVKERDSGTYDWTADVSLEEKTRIITRRNCSLTFLFVIYLISEMEIKKNTSLYVIIKTLSSVLPRTRQINLLIIESQFFISRLICRCTKIEALFNASLYYIDF